MDVIGPSCVVVHGINTQPDDLDVAPVELRLDPSHVAEFRRADRGEVLGMRKQHTPGASKPIVEADRTLRRLCFKIWCRPTNLKSQSVPLWQIIATDFPPFSQLAHSGLDWGTAKRHHTGDAGRLLCRVGSWAVTND